MNKALLEVEGLRKIYRSNRKETEALSGISFSIKKGEIVGLLGPNGAGKTTTIKCICSLIYPTSGKIYVKGVDALRHPSFALKNISAVLEGNRNIYWRMTVKENLEFFAGLQGLDINYTKESIENIIEFFNLSEKRNVQARFLSRGMQQKLAVACAFIKNTDILLLDEPTLGLDVESTYELKNLIREKAEMDGKTILLSSHNMRLIEDVCKSVIIINKGKIVVQDEVDNLKNFFRVNAYILEIEGKITAEDKENMKREFLLVKFQENKYNTIIEVEIKDTSRIYDIMDFLRKKRVMLKSIRNREPDFEEVYLRIIRNETLDTIQDNI